MAKAKPAKPVKPIVPMQEIFESMGKKRRYESIPSTKPGFNLIVEEGKRPEISDREQRRLGNLAVKYSRIFRFLSPHEKRQKNTIIDIKNIVKGHLGLAGIESEENNSRAMVYPTHKVTEWNEAELKKTLGDAYPSLVSEGLETEILIPYHHQGDDDQPLTARDVQEAILDAMVDKLGVTAREAGKYVKFTESLSVDHVRLGEMLASGQVVMSGDLGQIKETWNIDSPDNKTY